MSCPAEEMELQQRQSPPPPKAPRLSDAGFVTTALPPPVALGLGLGPGGSSGGAKSAFTFLQLQELRHQALVYKFMAAGEPVPLQLVLPIWKSVAGSSSSSSPFRGQHPLPSFMGGVGGGGLRFDYGSSVDPEPGRCRRTDGKKWRCSKDVVPNQKYCERHMHRGRHRSRKPVEDGAVGGGGGGASPSRSQVPVAAVASTSLSIAVPSGFQLMPTGGKSVSPRRLGFSPVTILQAGT